MGRDADPMVICDYNPAWENQFADLSAWIVASLQSIVLRIEHVGSTAVPGLAAKPIVDMDVVLASSADLPQAMVRILVAAMGASTPLAAGGWNPNPSVD